MSLLEVEIFDFLTKGKQTLAAAESCTGGLLSSRLIQVPSASQYYLGGIVAYSNQAKQDLLKVDSATLQHAGAVSEKTALEMAYGALNGFHSDYGIAVSGIAGPLGGSVEKPIGTVCFAIVTKRQKIAWTTYLSGNREEIMQGATDEALFRLVAFISGNQVTI